jgi:hypothetical protein
MGNSCDFFLATPSELRGVFPGWGRPAHDRVERVMRNPFTRTEIAYLGWVADPADDTPPAPVRGDSYWERISWLRSEGMSHVHPLMIGALLSVLLDPSTDPLDWIDRVSNPPPLAPPAKWTEGDESVFLFALPEPFVAALAALEESSLAQVADTWRNAMEDKDWDVEACAELLACLRTLARESRGNGKALFCVMYP